MSMTSLRNTYVNRYAVCCKCQHPSASPIPSGTSLITEAQSAANVSMSPAPTPSGTSVTEAQSAANVNMSAPAPTPSGTPVLTDMQSAANDNMSATPTETSLITEAQSAANVSTNAASPTPSVVSGNHSTQLPLNQASSEDTVTANMPTSPAASCNSHTLEKDCCTCGCFKRRRRAKVMFCILSDEIPRSTSRHCLQNIVKFCEL